MYLEEPIVIKVKYIPNSIPADHLTTERPSCIWNVERKRIWTLFTRGGYVEKFRYFKKGREFYFDNFKSSGLQGHEKLDYSRIKLDAFQIHKEQIDSMVE